MAQPIKPKRVTKKELEAANESLRLLVESVMKTVDDQAKLIKELNAEVQMARARAAASTPWVAARDAREIHCVGDGRAHRWPETWTGSSPAPCVRCGWSARARLSN